MSNSTENEESQKNVPNEQTSILLHKNVSYSGNNDNAVDLKKGVTFHGMGNSNEAISCDSSNNSTVIDFSKENTGQQIEKQTTAIQKGETTNNSITSQHSVSSDSSYVSRASSISQATTTSAHNGALSHPVSRSHSTRTPSSTSSESPRRAHSDASVLSEGDQPKRTLGRENSRTRKSVDMNSALLLKRPKKTLFEKKAERALITSGSLYFPGNPDDTFYDGETMQGVAEVDVVLNKFEFTELRVGLFCDIHFKDSLGIVQRERIYRTHTIIAQDGCLEIGVCSFPFSLDLPDYSPSSFKVASHKGGFNKINIVNDEDSESDSDDDNEDEKSVQGNEMDSPQYKEELKIIRLNTKCSIKYREISWTVRLLAFKSDDKPLILETKTITKSSNYTPVTNGYPRTSISKSSLLGNELKLNVILDKNVFQQRESIPFQVSYNNASSMAVERLEVELVQKMKIAISNKSFKCSPRQVICKQIFEKGFPLNTDAGQLKFTFNVNLPCNDYICMQNEELCPSITADDPRENRPESAKFTCYVHYFLHFTFVVKYSVNIQVALPVTISHNFLREDAKPREHKYQICRVDVTNNPFTNTNIVIERFSEYGVADEELAKGHPEHQANFDSEDEN